MRYKTALSYSNIFLERDRPQPLSDPLFENLANDVLTGKIDANFDDSINEEFIAYTEQHILRSSNKIFGLTDFTYKDIIIGCTHFIDNIYMQGAVQTLDGDYTYHQRLGLGNLVSIGNLLPKIPMIISMPFPKFGRCHPNMNTILAEAQEKSIPIHIDGAWITCSRNIDFDLSHPTIQSIGISLSKGLGLGWNRIGVRWCRKEPNDSVRIMNQFHMTNKSLVKVGLHYLKNVSEDFLWNTYSEYYSKVCRDFDLEETDSIHIALKKGNPVGVSPLLRFLNK
jgi:hypothetical protein